MSLLLYINGSVADLAPGTVIAQTRQVNDLNSIDNRQASYTNKFSLPKTANNVRIMNYLTLTGNTSNIPYKKNECSLYSSTGECFVYNGWAVVTDGGDSYDVVIYDGIIDLYKAIENQTLSSLGLTGISHEKTFSNIKDAWDNDRDYTYILADYNGDTTVNQPAASGLTVNLDYLVPSVKVSYLWDAIFSGPYRAEGSIFSHPDFTNLWLTFPKGVPNLAEQNTLVFHTSSNNTFLASTGSTPPRQYLLVTGTDYAEDPEGIVDNSAPSHIKVTQAGNYRIELKGVIHAYTSSAQNTDAYSRIYMGLNAQSQPIQNIGIWRAAYIALASSEQFSFTIDVSLNAGDAFCVVVGPPNSADINYYIAQNSSNIEIKVTKLAPSVIDFGEAFTDFSIRDFVTEVVQRFGLTMYKDKYSNIYRFLTLQEVLETAAIEDWSRKFIKKNQEDYIYGSYAQQNWFRYAYNDKEQSHSDWYLPVINANLPDSTNVFKSKIYSPERQKVTFLNTETNLYKLWDKEVVENPQEGQPSVKYKALDKRYYLLRAQPKETGITVQSNASAVSNGYTLKYKTESFSGLPFQDVLNTYYTPLTRILQNSLIVQVQLWLTDADVANFDFRKKYYIEQLGGNFIMNKITNYVSGKPTVCEMVRVG